MRSYEEFAAECPLVAILRGIRTEEVEKVCDALSDGGIRLLEITLNTPGALESISHAVRYVGDRQLVGAGTVLTPDEVDAVAQHGGKFIISPNTDPAVIRRTSLRPIPSRAAILSAYVNPMPLISDASRYGFSRITSGASFPYLS